ncbi:MAG: hypothetical protein R3F22_07010 [Lysobacteraceae bacterium]
MKLAGAALATGSGEAPPSTVATAAQSIERLKIIAMFPEVVTVETAVPEPQRPPEAHASELTQLPQLNA